VKIGASGMQRMAGFSDDDTELKIWGESQADKGYFQTDWDLVTVGDPQAGLVQVTWPEGG